ncbi:hypothetical protein PhCBS80983_g01252 [Powellomyces hirtus]|uniref:snRNA-activating protein complex subunit 3 n=1 Tax=Powellomyces hirtus TaxID=109895 RepID=A0A507EBI9_9FUNG|nr:hypothetical protein PhCBS80983_g01252 [Powellomyces hirtus]
MTTPSSSSLSAQHPLVNLKRFRDSARRVLAECNTLYELDPASAASLAQKCDVPLLSVDTAPDDDEQPSASLSNNGSSSSYSHIEPDVLLPISISRGRNKVVRVRDKTASYLVLGSQPLTVLRDAFYCPTDFLQLGDGDEDGGDSTNKNTLTCKTSASYFLIEDVFYNDFRNPDAEDYSSKIIEWVASRKSNGAKSKITTLRCAVMSETTFADLCVRPGTRYLFVHQGTCQHAVVFEPNLRMLRAHGDDVTDRTRYPIETFFKPWKSAIVTCQVCKARKAEWVTPVDIRADRDSCRWCQDCFDRFHFNEDGTPAYEFEYHKYRFTADVPLAPH